MKGFYKDAMFPVAWMLATVLLSFGNDAHAQVNQSGCNSESSTTCASTNQQVGNVTPTATASNSTSISTQAGNSANANGAQVNPTITNNPQTNQSIGATSQSNQGGNTSSSNTNQAGITTSQGGNSSSGGNNLSTGSSSSGGNNTGGNNLSTGSSSSGGNTTSSQGGAGGAGGAGGSVAGSGNSSNLNSASGGAGGKSASTATGGAQGQGQGQQQANNGTNAQGQTSANTNKGGNTSGTNTGANTGTNTSANKVNSSNSTGASTSKGGKSASSSAGGTASNGATGSGNSTTLQEGATNYVDNSRVIIPPPLPSAPPSVVGATQAIVAVGACGPLVQVTKTAINGTFHGILFDSKVPQGFDDDLSPVLDVAGQPKYYDEVVMADGRVHLMGSQVVAFDSVNGTSGARQIGIGTGGSMGGYGQGAMGASSANQQQQVRLIVRPCEAGILQDAPTATPTQVVVPHING